MSHLCIVNQASLVVSQWGSLPQVLALLPLNSPHLTHCQMSLYSALPKELWYGEGAWYIQGNIKYSYVPLRCHIVCVFSEVKKVTSSEVEYQGMSGIGRFMLHLRIYFVQIHIHIPGIDRKEISFCFHREDPFFRCW